MKRRSFLAVPGAALLAACGSPRERIAGFTATDLEGRGWDLRAHRGRVPVLVRFFATWCQRCREEFPEVVALHERFAGRGLEIALVTAEDAEAVRRTPGLASAPVTFLTKAGLVFRKYGIDEVPHTLFFDREGHLASEWAGRQSEKLRGVADYLASLPPARAS